MSAGRDLDHGYPGQKFPPLGPMDALQKGDRVETQESNTMAGGMLGDECDSPFRVRVGLQHHQHF